MCGCDHHGDHLACTQECNWEGCQEETADYTITEDELATALMFFGLCSGSMADHFAGAILRRIKEK